MTRTYDAVVLDNDGVLVTPTDRAVFVDAVLAAFAHLGVDVDRAVAERTVADGDVPTGLLRERGLNPAAFWHRREREASRAQMAAVHDGGKAVYDDVAALADLAVPLGLVSNNQDATVRFLLDYHDLAPYFETAYGRRHSLAGMARRKPDPYYLERALSDLGATDALYVGDSPTDLTAAERAGADAAFLRRPHVADVNLPTTPTYEVPDLRALVDALRRTGTGVVDPAPAPEDRPPHTPPDNA